MDYEKISKELTKLSEDILKGAEDMRKAAKEFNEAYDNYMEHNLELEQRDELESNLGCDTNEMLNLKDNK